MSMQQPDASSGRHAIDAEEQRALADATVQRAADQLRRQLEALARAIDPFPPFPGAMFAYGIEVEVPGVTPRDAAGEEIGCVVLGNDGQLYELQIGIDAQQVALGGDHVAARHEELLKLDLPPALYVLYAHAAVQAAAEWIERQR